MEPWDWSKPGLPGSNHFRECRSSSLSTRPSDPLWWTPECTTAVCEKQKAWKRFRQHPSDLNKELLKSRCNASVACLREAKARGLSAVRQRLQHGSLKNKQWWSTIKAAGGDGRQCSIPLIRDAEGRELSISKEKATCFGKFFSTKCSLQNDYLQPSELPHFPRRTTSVLSRVRFWQATIARELKRLDPSKATGIPARVLQQCASTLSLPLSRLFFSPFVSGMASSRQCGRLPTSCQFTSDIHVPKHETTGRCPSLASCRK